MDRTTIMLPARLKAQAKLRSQELGISLAEFIRTSLEEALRGSRESGRSADPLFRDVAVYRGEAPSDLAANHDHYLYDDA